MKIGFFLFFRGLLGCPLILSVFCLQPDEANARDSVNQTYIAREFSNDFNACMKRANGVHEALRSCADREVDYLSDRFKTFKQRIALNLTTAPRQKFLATERKWENGLFDYCQLHDGLNLFRSDPEPGLELVDCYLAEYAKHLIWLRKNYPAVFTHRN